MTKREEYMAEMREYDDETLCSFLIGQLEKPILREKLLTMLEILFDKED